MSLYHEVKRLIELGQVGNVLSSLHASRASPREEDLEEFYNATVRLLTDALTSKARRSRQYLDRLIDKAYRTIDRGGVKIVGGKPGLASRPRYEKLLNILDRHGNSFEECRVKTLKAIAYYALYPKYRRLPIMNCSIMKYDGIMKLMHCFTSSLRCMEAYNKLSEYKTIFTLRSALRAAYVERDPEFALRGALPLLHLGTPADKAEAYLILADLLGTEEMKEKAKRALKELENYCRGDYCGKIDRAIDYSRTCTRIPRLKEYAETVLRGFLRNNNRKLLI